MHPKTIARRAFGTALLHAGSAAVAVGAVSADDDSWLGAVTVAGDIGFLTDVRDRGLTLSDYDPSPVARLELSADSGAFLGLSGTLLQGETLGDARVKAYLGYGFDIGGFLIDGSVNLDGFFGVPDTVRDVQSMVPDFEPEQESFYPELEVGISRDFGLLYFRGAYIWAMEGRWSAPGTNSHYFMLDVDLPVPTVPALTLALHAGYDIIDVPRVFVGAPGTYSDRFDWSAGLSYFWRDFEVTLSYVDSDAASIFDDSRVIGGLRYYF